MTLDVLRGATNESIAQACRTSPSTVANQIAVIFEKLRVASRGELAATLHAGASAPAGRPRFWRRT